jgi:cytochrome c5
MNEARRNVVFVLTLMLALTSSACSGEVGGQSPEEVARLRADLSELAETTPEAFLPGKSAFESACATCHGPAAGGGLTGPPLVHTFYKPNRHADVAFHLAIQRGVRAHHWRFGDMPPVTGVDKESADEVVAYVRWLQREMGVE